MRTPRHLVFRFLLAVPVRIVSLAVSLLLVSGLVPAPAAPNDPLLFPAAGFKPTTQPVGPMQIAPVTNGVLGPFNPEDTVVFDYDSTEIDVINSQGATGGTRTVVASSSVGSGTAFTTKVNIGVVSPQEQLYYWDNTVYSFYRIDLTSASYPRTKVIPPSNNALVPSGVENTILSTLCWDFANNALVYFDNASSGTAPNGSTITKGIYRFTPSTTAGVPSTNVLVATVPSTLGCYGLAVKQDGTIYALLDNGSHNAAQINVVANGATTQRVDGTAGTYTAFQTISGIS